MAATSYSSSATHTVMERFPSSRTIPSCPPMPRPTRQLASFDMRMPWTANVTHRQRYNPVDARPRGADSDPSGSTRMDSVSADLLFEQNRWRWPAVGRQRMPGPLPPPPPPPPPRPSSPTTAPSSSSRGRFFNTTSPNQRGPPPPPPPPPQPPPLRSAATSTTSSSSSSPAPAWAEPLLRGDPELRDLMAENPELWADLQRRAGVKAGYMPPPAPPEAGSPVDPAAYDRQVQQWLRHRRAQGGGGGGQAAARQDDEIVSLALLYLAAAVPILAFALAAAW